jgi:hypothetical protein
MLETTKTQDEPIVWEEYTEGDLNNIAELCALLQTIRKRLMADGHSIEDLRKKHGVFTNGAKINS